MAFEEDYVMDGIPSAFKNDSNTTYEDPLGTQYDLGNLFDAHTSVETSSDLHTDQQVVPASNATEGSPHRSADDRVFIDLGTTNAEVESHGDSGPSPWTINVEEPTVVIKQESPDPAIVRANTEKITIDLSASDEEDVVVVGQIVKNVVKDEDLDLSWHDMGDETIEISDDEGTDLPRVNEPLFFSTDTEGNALASSDFDEPQQRSTATPVLAEPTPNNEHPSLHRSIFGEQPDHSFLRGLQENYMNQHLGRQVVTGAGSIFRGVQDALPQSERDSKDGNEDKDMVLDKKAEEDERNATTTFHKSRRDYKAKVKAGENSLGDDVRYLAAERREKARLKRLEIEYLRSRGPQDFDDSDQAADSDDGLFLRQFPVTPSTTKRTRNPREETPHGQEELLDADSPNSKRQATKARRERAKEFDEELRLNHLAGVEQIIIAEEQKAAKEKATKEHKERKRRQEQGQPQPKSKKNNTAKSKPARKSQAANLREQKHIENLRSLGYHNIYDEANKNADMAPGPFDHSTKKSDALKSLMASIPLEDLRAARRDRADIIRASKVLGFRTVRRDGEGAWEMKGLTSHLYDYQLTGTAMMHELETGLDKPTGGMMADQMGLGKTVMTIAAMVANRPSAGDGPKTTLIVAMPALVDQWMDEFAKHLKPGVFPGVIKHHALSKVAGSGALYIMQTADVVLTTYGEVIKSYPKFSPPEDLKTLEEKLSWWDEIWDTTRGALHRIHFHRVVLDEAHVIKNHMAQTSVACRALMGKHRWGITGTPIHNCVQELYPYFKFLRVPHNKSFEIFQKNFCNPADVNCTERLHAILKRILIRRTHATQLCGKPLIQLPRNHQRTIYVEFNSVERAIYDMVSDRYIKGINYFSSKGMLEEKHSLILTMLLRLRQFTAHPFLIQDTIERFLQTSEIDKLLVTGDQENETELRGKDMASAMKRMVEATNKPSDIVEDSTYTTDPEVAKQPLLLKFQKFLRELKRGEKWPELKERRFCQKCESPPVCPRVTSCLHIYCTECMQALADEAVIDNEQESTCITCAEVFTESCPCDGLKELEVEEPLLGSGDRSAKRGKKDQNADIKWIDVGGKLLPSSKTAAVEAQLEQWLTEEPEKKITVFSQFLMLFVESSYVEGNV